MKYLTSLLAVVVSIQSGFAAALDDHLESWLKQAGSKRSLVPETIEVIVFVEPKENIDHFGMIRSQAIQKEAVEQMAHLIDKKAGVASALSTYSSTSETLWSSSAIVAQIDRQSLRKLKELSGIKAIIHNKTITLDEPIEENPKEEDSELTYGLGLMNVEKAWNQGITGQGVRVGIIDSGIDEEHPDLQNKVVHYRDFTKDNNLIDENGHGTHVAGTIAGGDESGVAIGVAPDVELVVAKVFGASGGTDMKTLLKAMEWILDPDGDPDTDDAPRIVSNSWGSSANLVLGFRQIVQTWRKFDIFPNFAAGNSGPIYMSMGAPGRYPFSHAVAAVGRSSKAATFSSRGPVPWLPLWGPKEKSELRWFEKYIPIFYTKPDIAAPGVRVFSSLPNGDYDAYSGTSMAAPHVTGAIALALQVNPQLSVTEIEDLLSKSAIDLGSSGKDVTYGHGLLQADLLVERAKTLSSPASSSLFIDPSPSELEFQNVQ